MLSHAKIIPVPFGRTSLTPEILLLKQILKVALILQTVKQSNMSPSLEVLGLVVNRSEWLHPALQQVLQCVGVLIHLRVLFIVVTSILEHQLNVINQCLLAWILHSRTSLHTSEEQQQLTFYQQSWHLCRVFETRVIPRISSYSWNKKQQRFSNSKSRPILGITHPKLSRHYRLDKLRTRKIIIIYK